MARSTALASLATLAALAASPLAAQPPSVAGYVTPDAGNVVGGGAATLLGGGDDMVILYSPGGAGGGGADHAQPGRTARLTTDGDGAQVEYLDAAPTGAGHGREAWLSGGGDNAEVVYAPRTAR